jgi:hypothetical protein
MRIVIALGGNALQRLLDTTSFTGWRSVVALALRWPRGGSRGGQWLSGVTPAQGATGQERKAEPKLLASD